MEGNDQTGRGFDPNRGNVQDPMQRREQEDQSQQHAPQQRFLNIDTNIGRSISQPNSPAMSYSTDRETVMRSASGHATVAETHLIRSIGSQSQSYTEEHWSSEITSFVALAPPKFIQVIKAYRVLSSDTISLVVEVASDPPALFEWYCNEKSVLQDRSRFQVGHGINISRLKVHQPEEGVYKCVTKNPAGMSTSYGYIKVNSDNEHLSSSRDDVRMQRKHSITINQAPRFLTQVPNLFVTAGSQVVIDVEVEANPPARFSWFVNGREYRESTYNVEMFSPDTNRSVVRFELPVAGEYKVVASNVHGSAMSCGHVDIHRIEAKEMQGSSQMDAMARSMRQFDNNGRQSRQAVNLFELNYMQRSSSVPRGVRHLESHIEVAKEKQQTQPRRSGEEATDIVEARCSARSPKPPRGSSKRFLPEPPVFVTALPPYITLAADEKLMLSVDVRAVPAAELSWTVNGFELKRNRSTVLLNEHNKSTLVVEPPVKQGKYKITAVNDVGSTAMQTNVQRVGGSEDASSEPPDILETAVTVTASHEDEVGSHSSLQTVRRLEEIEQMEQEEEETIMMTLPKKTTRPASKKDLPFAPRIVEAPEGSPYRFADGDPAMFRIAVSALPPATFTWMLNNFELRNNANTKIINDRENTSCIEFKKAPNGNLSLRARNNMGEAKWAGKIVLQYPMDENQTVRVTEETRTTEEIEEYVSTLEEAVVNQVMPTNGGYGDRIVIIVRFDENRTTACNFEWMINQRNAEDIESVHIESTPFESILTIDRLTEDECGEIVCTVVNQINEVFVSSAYLSIQDDDSTFEVVPPDLPEESAPKIVEPLHSATFIDGQSMALRCRITANPSAAVVWTKDDVNVDEWVLNKDVSTTIKEDGVCELLNPEVFSEDSGLYKCTATNPHGTAETAAFINVEGVPYVKDHEEAEMSESCLTEDVSIILPPKFVEQLTPETDNWNQVGYVRCVALIQSSVPITVRWEKDGEEIQESDKYECAQFNDGAQILTVRNPTVNDTGVYTCTAESEHGVSSSSCQIHIDEEPVIKETGIDDDLVILNKEEVTGTADIEKREEEFKLLIKVADQVASTLVANVFLDAVREAVKKLVETEDECEDAPNGLNEEPRFVTSVEEYRVKEGDAIKMSSTISGNPKPFVEWYYGEEKLSVTELTSMSYDNGESSITLKDVKMDQTGIYYCHATNSHGTAVLSMRLVVEPKEEKNVQLICDTVTEEKITTTSEQQDEVDEERIKEEKKRKELEAAAELISEQFARMWTNDAMEQIKLVRDTTISKAPEEKVAEEIVNETTLTVDIKPEEENMSEAIENLDETIEVTAENIDIGEPTQQESSKAKAEDISDVKDASDDSRRATPDSVINMPYTEKVKTIESNLLRATSHENLQPIEATNLLLNTAMSLKDSHICDETTSVVVSQQPQTFEQIVTVLESNVEQSSHRLSTTTSVPLKFVDFDTLLQKPSTSMESVDKLIVEKPMRQANAQHRIVVLQGISNSFHNAMTWSLKKVKKLVGDSETKAYADIEVVKQDEVNEQVMTIIDNETIVPGLLEVAAAANKLKLENVSVTLVKEGDKSHQELVIEYESSIDEPMDDAKTSHLTFQQATPSGPDEHTWTRRSKYSSDNLPEAAVSAVFVDVDANCPNQNVEIVATINPGIVDEKEDGHLTEVSQSLATESSAAPQLPRFLRKLVHCRGRIGEPIQLKCLVAGMPTPDIQWTVDGDPIKANDEYTVVYEDGVCILRIESTLIEDEGEYCCTASNVAGSASTKCYLQLSDDEDEAAELLRQLSEQHVLPSMSDESYPMLSRHSSDDCRSIDFLSGREPPVTADYNGDLKRVDSFQNIYETADTVLNVFDLLQTEAVEQKIDAPVLSIETSTTDVTMSNRRTNVADDAEFKVNESNWDAMMSDPFPESNRFVADTSDINEPRALLLPNKISYKGQPIVANSETKSGPKDLKKYVETLLQFDANVSATRADSDKVEDHIVDEMKKVDEIADQVERDWNGLVKRDHDSQGDDDEDTRSAVETIEQAIFYISDHLVAESEKEGVLREKLATMILKERKMNNENAAEKLHQKITEIENHLLEDNEVTEIMKRRGNEKDKRMAVRIKRVPSAHSARITPITANLKHQLSQLHQLTVESAEGENLDEDEEIRRLFKKIETEIETISELCQRKMTKCGAETVRHVLSSVLQHVITIVNVIRVAQDLQPINEPATAEVSVWYEFEIRSEAEDIIGIVDIEQPMNQSLEYVEGLATPMTLSTDNATIVDELKNHELMQRSTQSEGAMPIAPPRKKRSESREPPIAPPRRRFTSPESVPIRPPRSKSRSRPIIEDIEKEKDASVSFHAASMEHWFYKRDNPKEQTKCFVNLSNFEKLKHYVAIELEDLVSMDMLCEESDYATDTDGSLLLQLQAAVPIIEPVEEEEQQQQIEQENVEDIFVDVELHSVSTTSLADESNKKGNVVAELSFGRSSPDETLHVVLEEKELSQMNGSADFVASNHTIRETDILSDESMTTSIRILEDHCISENISFAKKQERRRVTGLVTQVIINKISATVAADNTFDVDIVQEPQKYSISVKVIEELVDFTSLTIQGEEEEQIDEKMLKSMDDISEATTRTGVTVSIVARSLHDGIYASLEEIAWGEVEMTLPDVMTRSVEEPSRNSLFNVTVSETNLEEGKSLKSQMSLRSSQNSVSEIANTVSSSGTVSIPSYVVKLESTATITCELNNYLPANCAIDWYRGKSKIEIDNVQYDRISHDLLEVLIIRSVEEENGDLYSLKINYDLFPVAYLIVENSASMDDGSIITRPQTQFVMEEQRTIITCVTRNPSTKLTWLKDRRPLHETNRIRLENDDCGTHRVIIHDTEISDQGTYTALTSSQSVAITLVVEERIDEKEVTVVPSGTESEDEDVQEYLVPPGSTATIACELEECEMKRSIKWMRDGEPIKFVQGKIEHVQNGLKHYLVVHDANSMDSGLYSVCISNVEFRVAHLCVNSVTSTLHALKRKRISNHSLH